MTTSKVHHVSNPPKGFISLSVEILSNLEFHGLSPSIKLRIASVFGFYHTGVSLYQWVEPRSSSAPRVTTFLIFRHSTQYTYIVSDANKSEIYLVGNPTKWMTSLFNMAVIYAWLQTLNCSVCCSQWKMSNSSIIQINISSHVIHHLY